MSSQFQLCKQHCVLTRKISIRGAWNPRAFVPQATQYFPSSFNSRPGCVVAGDEDCLHNYCLCHTMGHICWLCACVYSVLCGEGPLCTVDLQQGGEPGLTSAVLGWGWCRGAVADISLLYALSPFTVRQSLLCFPKEHHLCS